MTISAKDFHSKPAGKRATRRINALTMMIQALGGNASSPRHSALLDAMAREPTFGKGELGKGIGLCLVQPTLCRPVLGLEGSIALWASNLLIQLSNS